MPDVFRIPTRMDCTGLDLTHPIDRMPPGAFPYLFNVRILAEGRLEGRPGYTRAMVLSDPPNSVRRLNDPARSYAPDGYTYVGGGGTRLYTGVEAAYAPADDGYSGNPLSLIPFRPDQSPESWMYVYDANKNTKVRPDGLLRDVGIAPPSLAPVTEYGVPAFVHVTEGQSASGWAATGAAASPTATDRTGGASPTITSLLYNEGTTGWCCIHPSDPVTRWTGQRMGIVLDSGGGNEETVIVREIHNAITSTTVEAINYDVGTDGLCSLVLTGSPIGLDRNSLISIGGEVIRVLSVIFAPDGTRYSIRCSTTATHAATNAVTGLLSWYVYTVRTHVAAETITSEYIHLTQSGAGTGGATFTSNINASAASGRPVSEADDFLHVSIFLDDPSAVTSVMVMFPLDAIPVFSFDNPGNALLFTFPQVQLIAAGASAGSWVEMVVPISSATRRGGDFTRTLANISGVAFQVITTAASNWGFDWAYLFGTFGPTIQPNSPVGIQYLSRFRDASTGAHSVPGPFTSYDLFPVRESVIITPQATPQAAVDTIDIYRLGGAVTSPLYVSSIFNDNANPRSYLDDSSDSVVVQANQPPDLTALQPWPTLVQPWAGVCHVIGTTVIWDIGDKFDPALLNNSVILIDGTAYLTRGQPKSDTVLEINQSAGYLASANFLIASPTLAGKPLPFAFGALEGPFAPVVFALGDPLNGGLLYYSNFSDADSASDANTLELATPGQDLVSGAIWGGLVIVGSREDIFSVRYSYLSSVGSVSYQWAKVTAPSGMWSRWACCATPVGVAYMGKDGIYLTTDSQCINITDEKLYPLFPHDGDPAKEVRFGDNVILPVDMTLLSQMSLTYCDEAIRFGYRDTGGNFNTLIFQINKKRWLIDNYANDITAHYMVEPDSKQPNRQEILMLAFEAQAIMLSGGNTDNGELIHSVFLLPANDGGDDRTQKLYVDQMIDADGDGTFTMAAYGTDVQHLIALSEAFITNNLRRQYLLNLSAPGQSVPCGGGGAAVLWIDTTTPPDGVRTAFSFPQLPNYVSWNGLNQFQDTGYILNLVGNAYEIRFIDSLGGTLTPGNTDIIRAEVT